MEVLIESLEVKEFLSVDEYIVSTIEYPENGSGDALGWGDSKGCGDGEVAKMEDRDFGNGLAEGSGNDQGTGFGWSHKDCNTYSWGFGYGNRDEADIKYLNGKKIYQVDGVPTIIESVHGNYAKGRVLNSDFTTEECFIAKYENYFAHGQTLKEAQSDAKSKYEQNIPIEERIARFNKEYPNRNVKVPASDLFRWHNLLTGSCLFGRKQFCEEHNIDYENGEYTVNEFIEITKNAYGSFVIKQLENSL